MMLRQLAYIDISHYKNQEDFKKLEKYVEFAAQDEDPNKEIIQEIKGNLCLILMETLTELKEEPDE